MLNFVLRKIFNNRWMVLCIVIGAVFTVAMVSSIPTYSYGILQRMLIKDLEGFQQETGNFPGNYKVGVTFFKYMYKGNELFNAYEAYGKKIDAMAQALKLPYLTKTHELGIDDASLLLKNASESGNEDKVNIKAVEDIGKHIKITNGDLFSGKKADGAIDAILTEKGINNLGLKVGEVYTVKLPSSTGSILIRVTGVFDVKNSRDTFWFRDFKEYDNCVFIDFPLLKEEIKNQNITPSNAYWNYALDYHKLNLDSFNYILKQLDTQQMWYNKNSTTVKFELAANQIFKQYQEREKQLTTVLWALDVPVLLVLTLYIFMVSQLIVRNEENEIAVLKSRGASRSDIFKGYFIESLIIGLTAIALGPIVGLILCNIIGASNGFLEFVQRNTLPVSLNLNVYLFALLTMTSVILTMCIPAFLASRATIVQYTQSKSAAQKKAFWERLYLDFVILAISLYGLYRYNSQQKILAATGVKALEIDIDPLMFLISTFFVLGVGLLFLRIFPYIIRLVFWLGRKFWPPVLYASFIQIGRSRGREQFLMIFIILALSMGIYSANTARTLNRNSEDKIRYKIGADVTLMARWDLITDNSSNGTKDYSDQANAAEVTKANEPPFTQFESLAGIERATKVYVEEDTKALTAGKNIDNVQVMGIVPNEFGKVIFFRNDLLPFHINQYLNLIAGAPKGFLVSSNIRDKYKAKAGDPISVSYLRNSIQYTFNGVIYGFVEYWPGFNPRASEIGKIEPSLVVGNLQYIQQSTRIEPYQVWMKEKAGATDEALYKDIANKKLELEWINSTSQSLIKMKNDPLLQGINGILTLGFIVTMVICTIGFLIFWILSIRSRVLQFGIFRAMGLPMKKVLSMIIFEQIMISGTAILLGIIIGGIACDIFIPLLQLIYSSSEQVPPFKVTAYSGDYIKIYVIVMIMLFVGFAVLRTIIGRIKINQAIKLGEE